MELKKALGMGAVIAVMAAASASAEPNPSYFEGWRLGLGVGDVTTRLDHSLSGASITGSHGSESLDFTLSSGFDRQIGDRFLIGGEFDLKTAARPIRRPMALGVYSLKGGLGEQLSARAGLLLTPRYLVFVRAGYASQTFSRVEQDGAGLTLARSRKSLTSPMFGVGLEHAFGPRLSARSELQVERFASGIHQTTGLFSLHYKF